MRSTPHGKRRRISEGEQAAVGSPPPPGWAQGVAVLVDEGPAGSPAGGRARGSALATPVRVSGPVACPFENILPQGYRALPCPPAEQMVARSTEAQKLEGVELLLWAGSGGWCKGTIHAACRARSKKTLDGEPVTHLVQYQGWGNLITTDMVLKAATYATSEEGVSEAWLLIEKVSAHGERPIRAQCTNLHATNACKLAPQIPEAVQFCSWCAEACFAGTHGCTVCGEPVHHLCSNGHVDSGVDDDLRSWCRKCAPKLRK